jgi:hypothetical protein
LRVSRSILGRIPMVPATVLGAIIGLSLGPGCATKTSVPPAPLPESVKVVPEPIRTLPERVAVINILDERTNVSPKDRLLNMPEWTIVGQQDRVRPILTEAQDALIRSEIRRYFGPGPPDVTVDVYVLSGTQTFKAGERYESITATFGLRVEVASHASVHDVIVAEGEASLDRQALDITYDQLNDTYEGAIVHSIHNAIERVISQRDQSRNR